MYLCKTKKELLKPIKNIIMCTVLVRYDKKNKIAKSLMYVLSQTKGVEIDDEAVLTDEEFIRIEKARKSGIRTDIENLQAYLKSQYRNYN